jgi:hypothetical protein
VDHRHEHRTLAGGGGHAFDAAGPHAAGSESLGHTGGLAAEAR